MKEPVSKSARHFYSFGAFRLYVMERELFRGGEPLRPKIDVSGHGVQAALTSMLLKATFPEAAESAREPHGFLEKMNGVLHRFLPSGMFVAATFLWLEHGQPVVRLSNAGLPYPFVLRSGELPGAPCAQRDSVQRRTAAVGRYYSCSRDSHVKTRRADDLDHKSLRAILIR